MDDGTSTKLLGTCSLTGGLSLLHLCLGYCHTYIHIHVGYPNTYIYRVRRCGQMHMHIRYRCLVSPASHHQSPSIAIHQASISHPTQQSTSAQSLMSMLLLSHRQLPHPLIADPSKVQPHTSPHLTPLSSHLSPRTSTSNLTLRQAGWKGESKSL